MSALSTDVSGCGEHEELATPGCRSRLLVEGPLYQFADCVLNVQRSSLFVNGSPVRLPLSCWDALLLLLAERHRLVTSRELSGALRTAKPTPISTVAATIHALRKRIGDNGHTQVIIKNSYGRGYRFVAETRSYDELLTVPRDPDRHSSS